jgi:hypothetical protein
MYIKRRGGYSGTAIIRGILCSTSAVSHIDRAIGRTMYHHKRQHIRMYAFVRIAKANITYFTLIRAYNIYVI